MAKKKENTELPTEPAKEAASEGTLVKAAKAIGTAAGKVASAVGAEPAEPAKKKTAKFQKKNKQRLPRRQKKAAQKKGAGAA